MSEKKREGEYRWLLGVICLAVFFVSSPLVQAAVPVAIDAVVAVTDPSGTDIELSAAGGSNKLYHHIVAGTRLVI